MTIGASSSAPQRIRSSRPLSWPRTGWSASSKRTANSSTAGSSPGGSTMAAARRTRSESVIRSRSVGIGTSYPRVEPDHAGARPCQARHPKGMWVLFDLNGTLVDPAVLIDPPELPVAALDEANVMAMITVIAGRAADFKPLLGAALRRGLERAGRDPALAEGALERLPEMPAYP